jgi:hypothetical protein
MALIDQLGRQSSEFARSDLSFIIQQHLADSSVLIPTAITPPHIATRTENSHPFGVVLKISTAGDTCDLRRSPPEIMSHVSAELDYAWCFPMPSSMNALLTERIDIDRYGSRTRTLLYYFAGCYCLNPKHWT